MQHDNQSFDAGSCFEGFFRLHFENWRSEYSMWTRRHAKLIRFTLLLMSLAGIKRSGFDFPCPFGRKMRRESHGNGPVVSNITPRTMAVLFTVGYKNRCTICIFASICRWLRATNSCHDLRPQLFHRGWGLPQVEECRQERTPGNPFGKIIGNTPHWKSNPMKC